MTGNLFNSSAFFCFRVLSIIDCFNVLSNSKVSTSSQSRNLVYLVIKIDMYSSVVKIATLVNRAVLQDITTPMLKLIIDNVEMVFVEEDPNKFSVRNTNTFFLFKLLSFFLN